tara:strand:+ start:51 stop:488 length:438 start_codon:yes stop_codon:yes gene_type:complete
MIISCEKCSKKFEISDNLIPDEGRLLQCGSCSYKWHYTPVETIKLEKEVDNTDNIKEQKKIIKTSNKSKIKNNENLESNLESNQNYSVGFISYILVAIISLISVIILVDTFKNFFSSFIPGIDFYLLSLNESLKDVFLFFKDLIK